MAKNKKPRKKYTPPQNKQSLRRGSLFMSRFLSEGIGWTKEERNWLTYTLMMPIHALIASKGREPQQQWAAAKSELVLVWVLVEDAELKAEIARANFAFQVAFNCWLKHGTKHVLYPQLWQCRDTMLSARSWILEHLKPFDVKAIGTEMERSSTFFDAAEEQLDKLLNWKDTNDNNGKQIPRESDDH